MHLRSMSPPCFSSTAKQILDTSLGFLQNDVSNFFMKVFAELFSKSDRKSYYLLASSIATATATVILMPAL